MYDEDIEIYEEDLRDKETKDEYYDDDPWENYGEEYDDDWEKEGK